MHARFIKYTDDEINTLLPFFHGKKAEDTILHGIRLEKLVSHYGCTYHKANAFLENLVKQGKLRKGYERQDYSKIIEDVNFQYYKYIPVYTIPFGLTRQFFFHKNYVHRTRSRKEKEKLNNFRF